MRDNDTYNRDKEEHRYLKKRRMYFLCTVPTEWLYQRNGKKKQKKPTDEESNPFCIFKTKTYLQMHATCSISIDTKSNKTRYTE